MRLLDEAARAAGVRVFAPERPGMGVAPPAAPWRIADWPAHAAAAADALGIDRFAVLGWSGGGPYALACAAALADRITQVILVAAPAPAEPERSRHGTDPLRVSLPDQVIEALARRSVPAARGALVPLAAVARRWPAPLRRFLGDELAASVAEAFRQGTRGVALDYRAIAIPWGFALADVAVPVDLWHGDADTTVPIAHAERLAARLPHATLHRLPGAGHLALSSHAREVLAGA